MKIVNNYTDKIRIHSNNTEYEIPIGLTASNYTPEHLKTGK